MTPVQFRFITWVNEREKARACKALKIPYMGDPIIEQYRFCNVNREHDAVTIWIRRNVRPTLAKLPFRDVVYNLYLCRVFNEPEVLEAIMPVSSHKMALNTLRRRRMADQKLLRGAYLVVPHGVSTPVEHYYMNLADKVRQVDWDRALDHRCPPVLQMFANALLPIVGMGEFMVNQVAADLRYQRGYSQWADWDTFVLAGPGTRRGLARWLAGTKAPPRNPKGRIAKQTGDCGALLLDIREQLLDWLSSDICEHFKDPNNLSNCFCEFDKYERARDGEASLRKYGNHNSEHKHPDASCL